MGKPFHSELEKLQETYQWAIQQSVDDIRLTLLHNSRRPLFIVGSGGSLSVCHFIAYLYQQHGMMAKAITPLELFYSKQALRESNVLFVSASGRNTDILFGYKTAVQYEPHAIYSVCMRNNSPLAKLATTSSISKHFDFNLPTGKDGFLATNSLMAFFGIFSKIFCKSSEDLNLDLSQLTLFKKELTRFFERVTSEYTFSVLYAGWGHSIAIDLESKLAEAALGDILISDYRNFGHGRHHWFDKRGESSAIIALITPQEESIALKTLALMPAEIPVLKIVTKYNNTVASIDLLVKAFYFVEQLGILQGIDPGRPGVPEYGRKLYHLNYHKIYNSNGQDVRTTAIIRKADVPSYDALSEEEKAFWVRSYDSFVQSLITTDFGITIFDYDGTLCSAKNRFKDIDEEISQGLNRILSAGFIVGIATGRGKSVRIALQNAIEKKYWSKVIVGYYNCGEIGNLSDDNVPDKDKTSNPSLIAIFNALKDYKFPVEIFPELRPNQLVIEIQDKADWTKVRLSIIQLIINLNISGIQILESSHSMDIIDQTETNKLNIIKYCVAEAKKCRLPKNYICFGDKGKWPGNDYQLLSTKYSLSVDEVSAITDSCWNLAKPGIKNIEATLYYMSCLKFNKSSFQIML